MPYPARLLNLVALLMGALALAPVAAQTFPSKAITVLVGYPAGGGLDTFCRTVTNLVAERLGQPMLVQNRAGAEGHIGLTTLAKAAPDGYTISCVPHSMTQSPHLSALAIDIFRDLAPIARLASWQFTLVVRADLAARNLSEFIALAKSKPGSITMGTAGAASRLTAALLESRAGIRLLVVPHPGTAAVQTALLGGHIDSTMGDATFAGIRGSAEGSAASKARPLAIMADKRDPLLPGVPAIAEQFPGLDPRAWYGVIAPAGTPAEIVDRLNASFVAVMSDPGVSARLAARGLQSNPSTPQEFASQIRSDYDRYGAVIKEFGIGAK